MFIQTEATPNPESLKFLPGCEVMMRGTAEFNSVEEAGKSPLALRLFKIEGVTAIFLGKDFITVSKADDAEWDNLKTEILGSIMEHFTNGEEVIIGEEASSISENDSEIIVQIKELLETRVRPIVAQDGGDIVFADFDEASGIVYLHLQGACAGCPGSTATLKNGVENMLKHFIPEITEVQAIN